MIRPSTVSVNNGEPILINIDTGQWSSLFLGAYIHPSFSGCLHQLTINNQERQLVMDATAGTSIGE